jgi:nitrogen regulatory protein PII
MTHLVVFVVNQVDQYPDVLDAWEEAGAKGATILESTGMARIRCAARDDLPLIPSLRDLLGTQEFHHRTLFTLVESEETLQRVIDASRQLVGSFEQPNSGLLFVVPVSMVFGLNKDFQETDPCAH